MGLNRISIKEKGLSNSGKCEKEEKQSPEEADVDNCGIVDVHWGRQT